MLPRESVDAVVSAVEHRASDEEWLEILAELDARIDDPAWRRVSRALGEALHGLLVEEGVWSRPVGRLALELWERTDAFHVQFMCDFAGAALAHDPHDDRAVTDYLRATFHDDPYFHRGKTLASVAERLPDGSRKALLLALHGFIEEAVYESGAGCPWLERAVVMHPTLAWQAMVELLRPILSGDRVDANVVRAADGVASWLRERER